MTVAVIVLAVIVGALLIDRAYTARIHARERRDLIDALLARTPQELKILRTEAGPPPERVLLPDGFEGQWGA